MDPVIDATLRTALALLFLVAAGHKLRDLGRFRATLAEYRLVPAALAALALAGLVPVHPRALLWVDALTVAGATAALAAFYASLDRMIVFAPGLARLRGDA